MQWCVHSFLPSFIDAIFSRHKMEFSLVQLKDHLKNTVEATCRGDPGAVFLSSTVRTSTFATQVPATDSQFLDYTLRSKPIDYT